MSVIFVPTTVHMLQPHEVLDPIETPGGRTSRYRGVRFVGTWATRNSDNPIRDQRARVATQHTRVSTDRVRKSAKKGSATSELDVVRFAVRAELSRSYSASIPPLYSGLARSRATATLLARRWARACGPRTLASNAPTPHAALNGAPLQRSPSCTA